MCALVDPAKLRYLEEIAERCEVSLSGMLTADSERDVRSRMITSIEIAGDKAVAHTRGLSGARDLELHRTERHWLILGLQFDACCRPAAPPAARMNAAPFGTTARRLRDSFRSVGVRVAAGTTVVGGSTPDGR